jgi:hypothetical protein
MSGQVSDEEFTARFEAARKACFAGHDAGCMYGGLTPEGGYWLAVEECQLDHGYACAGCGGTADFRFGDWYASSGDLLIWAVGLCGACRDRELALHPEKWRAPASSPGDAAR